MALIRVWNWIKAVREDALLLFFAWRADGTPKELRGMILLVLLYLLSPVDIIPDVVPFAGLVDDMLLVPAAISFLSAILPPQVMEEAHDKKARWSRRVPYLVIWFAVLVVFWIGVLVWLIFGA